MLFRFLILRHHRRELVHVNATDHPTAAWAAHQLVETVPEETASKNLLRNRDAIYGNMLIKVSGACTLSREPYPFPDIWDPLARVFDAWGFERCLWGTDSTRAFAVVDYEQAVEPFRQTDRLSDSERAMLMGGACAKACWSPKKG